MKIAYFANGPLYKDELNRFYSTSYSNSSFSRYLCVADEIVLCMRVEKKENDTHMSAISLDEITVVECADFIGITKGRYRRKGNEIIKQVVQCCEYIVVRLPSIIGRLAINNCIKLNKRYLVEMVGCPWDSLWNHSWKGKMLAPFAYLQTRYYVKRAPAVIYVTNRFLQRRYPTMGKNIGCSDVEIKKSDPIIIKTRADKIKAHKNKIIIGTIAAVNVKYKGQQYVIRALSRLKKEGFSNFEYQLVGTGDSSYLRKIAKECKVEEQVRFLGGIAHESIFDWLDKIDIYIQPSRQEGLPRAMIEAMSRGLPVIGANTGGIPELINTSCIFENINGCDQKIAALIKSFDENEMLYQSRINYETSLHYTKEELEYKRKEFYRDFFKNE